MLLESTVKFGTITLISFLFLVYLIYASIMKPIEFQNEKEARYEVAVKTMLDIKKLQTGYKSVHGKYADTFDELVKFVENGEFEIISRRDTAVIDAAKNAAFGIKVGADGVGGFFKDEVIITKLGTVKVKDSLFKNSDRYKRLNVVKVGEVEVPVVMKTGVVSRNDMNLSVFQAIIDKNALLKMLSYSYYSILCGDGTEFSVFDLIKDNNELLTYVNEWIKDGGLVEPEFTSEELTAQELNEKIRHISGKTIYQVGWRENSTS